MYDLIIIGGSAAATSAGIYAARRGLKFKIISKDFGGEVATSGEIGNWPGISETNGIELTQKFREHLDFYKADIEEGVEVESVTKQEDGSFCVTTRKDGVTMAAGKMPDGTGDNATCDYAANTVIIATGVHPRELGVPGEKEFRNKGVSYCSTCDMPLFAGKTVATIGGGNSALESALMGADIASKVYVINKNPEFKGDKVLIENLNKKPNVEVIYNAGTTEILGGQPRRSDEVGAPTPKGASGFVTGLKYMDKDGKINELRLDGTFIHIGMVPNSEIVPAEVEKNKFGEIVVNQNCETNVPGLYAAGDVTDVPFKQIVIAAGQGCIATLSAVQYLNKLKQ